MHQLRLNDSGQTPDPRTFDGIHPWLRAALEATGQTPRQVALAIGLSKNAIAELLAHPERVPNRPTLDKLAAYFNVDAAELRAVRPKRDDRVALGHRQMARLGPERAAEIAERGRASKREKMAARTPEERSAITRATGAASRRRNSSEDFARMGQLGEQVMQERGYKHSAEGRAAMSERVRRTGQSATGARAAHAKYGIEHPGVLALREIARAKRNGATVLCHLCMDPERPLYRSGSALRRSERYRHRECFISWLRSEDGRAYISKQMAVTQIVLKVQRHGDEKLQSQVAEQARAMRSYLRNPKRRGRPAMLLDEAERAIAAAIMHDEYDISAREIGELAGKPTSKVRGTDWETPARDVWDWIRFGRALLRTTRDAGE